MTLVHNQGILTSDNLLYVYNLCHYHGNRCVNNERLEFLGDAVIEYLVR